MIGQRLQEVTLYPSEILPIKTPTYHFHLQLFTLLQSSHHAIRFTGKGERFTFGSSRCKREVSRVRHHLPQMEYRNRSQINQDLDEMLDHVFKANIPSAI